MRVTMTLAILLGTMASAMADSGALIVIPGRPGVPVMMYGRDVSYGVVEYEWGLAHHFKPQTIVYGGWDEYIAPEVGHYFPSAGRKPGYGRLEIEPPANRRLPQPAESYHQSWSAQSPQPAQQNIPYNPPPVIVAPEIGGGRQGGRFQQFRN
jgi:hypothetical protein